MGGVFGLRPAARIRWRTRLPVIALLLLAPSIPELLTGSTPITELVLDPIGFAIGFASIVGLYGTGALLIREFAVYFRKGWATILLLGAAYGIAEEGLAVHTFFEPAGMEPVGALGSYGHAWGVNWLWALGLTGFHAVYSIALPILLVGLWFPEVRSARWLTRRSATVVAGIYVFVVAVYAVLVGHGPTPALFALFLGIDAVLIALALGAPADFLRARPGPPRIGRWGLAFSGTLFFDGWVVVLILSGTRVPAVMAAAVLLALSLVAIAVVLRRVGTMGLERSEFYFATGMLGVLFLWDVLIEFTVPGILAVTAVFVYLLYRLNGTLARRERAAIPAPIPTRATA